MILIELDRQLSNSRCAEVVRRDDRKAADHRLLFGVEFLNAQNCTPNNIDRKQTINGARGCNRKIVDRFDLTLECVRRHYLGQSSPLGPTCRGIESSSPCSRAFEDTSILLLNDSVIEDCAAVKLIMPFDDFNTPAVPMNRGTVSGAKPLRRVRRS